MTTDDDYTHRRLWASVIIQALIDATSEPKLPAAQVEKSRAHSWFVTESGTTAQNFEAVCLAADLEPGMVRKFYMAYEGGPLTIRDLVRLRNFNLREPAE